MSRVDDERLIKRGSWIEHFNLYRAKLSCGLIQDSVAIPLQSNDPDPRVWLYFYAPYHPSHDLQMLADWRRRR